MRSPMIRRASVAGLGMAVTAVAIARVAGCGGTARRGRRRRW